MEDRMDKWGYTLKIQAFNRPKYRNWYICYLLWDASLNHTKWTITKK
jgi:hypothetical protein